MANIFHIIPKEDWLSAQKHGIYSPVSLNIEGFIHCSNTDQIIDVANSLYRSRGDLLLLRIYRPKVSAEIKDEPPLEAPMSGLIFPHIYGDLNLDAVEKVFEFPCNESGSFKLPSNLLDE
ncbi:MAG: DUF952 domain-containing protein [Bacteriovoracaceae bacterium]|nr:DUF952 domain-containing protein [Bacteriovoracaceae bacterium]